MTFSIQWGRYLEWHERERSLEVIVWWFGCGVWLTNHAAQESRTLFHTRDPLCGVRLLCHAIRKAFLR